MDESWIGLVPAAGRGTRLGLPFPKELFPIVKINKYKPVAEYAVNQIIAAGVKHIVFVINESKHQLLGYFGSGRRFGCSFSYVTQDSYESINFSRSPGLAHAINSAFHLIQNKNVLFGMPDTIIQPENVFLQGMDFFDHSDVILYLFPTETPSKFGMVRMDSKQKVQEIIDKPTFSDLKYMWGCIMWKPVFTDFIHSSVENGVFDFAEIMNAAIVDGIRFLGLHLKKGEFVDLGTYEDIFLFSSGQ